MSSGAQPCRHCGRPVVMRTTRTGKTWPFENDLVSVDTELPEDLRYVPTPGDGQVIMVPIADVSPHRLLGLRWYAVRHICAEWLRGRQGGRSAVARAMSADWSEETPAKTRKAAT